MDLREQEDLRWKAYRDELPVVADSKDSSEILMGVVQAAYLAGYRAGKADGFAQATKRESKEDH